MHRHIDIDTVSNSKVTGGSSKYLHICWEKSESVVERALVIAQSYLPLRQEVVIDLDVAYASKKLERDVIQLQLCGDTPTQMVVDAIGMLLAMSSSLKRCPKTF